jgi:hypothetical protein
MTRRARPAPPVLRRGTSSTRSLPGPHCSGRTSSAVCQPGNVRGLFDLVTALLALLVALPFAAVSGCRQALLQREQDQLGALVQIQLVANVIHVIPHSLRADRTIAGHLFGASPTRDPGQDLTLTFA